MEYVSRAISEAMSSVCPDLSMGCHLSSMAAAAVVICPGGGYVNLSMNLEEAIISLEETLFQKEIRNSGERLSELLSPEFREIGASGNYFGLDEVLRSLPTEDEWSIKALDYSFRRLSDDIAQLTYRAFIKHSATDEGVYSIRNSIWKKHSDDQWKMEFHQATKVAPLD